ncbi:MAG: glycosyltransferase family 2 protein [Burkholderiaceae bacterium]|nr:glycosyltransferase family 2 protein [Microbacteriaceae bacterium]
MSDARASFAAAGEHAEIALVVVTYNNADHVAGLLESLRAEAVQVGIRLIVTDNASADDTVALLSTEPNVIVVQTGGNLGYAGGVNAASAHLGAADAVLVLNPDLAVEPGCLRAMLDRLEISGAGVVVPRLVGTDGATSLSLRREPTIVNSLGDALFGAHLAARPAALSETVLSPGSYESAHPVEWSTGAAVLTRRDIADAIGDWDERFFLYSEEVDYLRRARERGASIWFEPSARMRHDEGGSGASVRLKSLMAVNRVRYVRKYHSAGYAAAFHATVILHAVMRSYSAAHRQIMKTLLDQRSWRDLPRATRTSR